ncbi:MAG: pantetheine-phosphate adenylyltransferase [Elusimicrobia bacterium]|nr:pantetheine-phosphate adenylyltransferase [Elusimicrobiota bacterium]
MAKTAVYPGSFDPITKGHLDIIQRACQIFDKLIVAVTNNPQKNHAFTAQERISLIRESLGQNSQVEVDTFSGLLVDYLKSKRAQVLIRGLRAVSDLEYEFQMASMNRHLYSEVETVFLMPGEDYTYLTSSIVREVAALKGDLKKFVPASVEKALKKKFA